MDNVGRSPGNELHRIRIERAKKLLSDSDEKMDVIAELCGYESGNISGRVQTLDRHVSQGLSKAAW